MGEHSSRMMRLLVTLGCLAALSSGMSDVERRIWRDINSFNGQVICWGHKNVMAFTTELYKAMEECENFGKSRNPFTKPANPFAQLQQDCQTLPRTDGRTSSRPSSTETRGRLRVVSSPPLRRTRRNSRRTLPTGSLTWLVVLA